MCQVNEDYNDLQDRPSIPKISKKCMKCKEDTAVLLIRVGDAFCRSCFKEYFIHKFRAMLGKNRVIFPGEKVLLAVSGGPASSCMLAQVQEGLSRDTAKKLRFAPGIVYIDEGGVCGRSLEERERSVSQLEDMFGKTGFPYHVVSLEQVFTLPPSVLESVCGGEKPSSDYKAAVDGHVRAERRQGRAELPVGESRGARGRLGTSAYTPEHGAALEGLFSSVKTQTAKEDLLHTLRQHLITHTARLHGYTKAMMGDSCTRVAIKLLSNISLGRGASLAADTAFSDGRYGDVVTVRPMRDHSSKEIAFYNRLFCVQSVFVPGPDTTMPAKSSIQRLTESFVVRLQADFPSTVSTVYRTGEKLHTPASAQGSAPEAAAKCLLCLCTLDTRADEASAFHATLVSEWLCLERKSDCGGGGGEGKCCQARAPAATDLKTGLCYGCRLTVKDVAGRETLPPYVAAQAERRHRRAAMKKEIGMFLLDDRGEEEGTRDGDAHLPDTSDASFQTV